MPADQHDCIYKVKAGNKSWDEPGKSNVSNLSRSLISNLPTSPKSGAHGEHTPSQNQKKNTSAENVRHDHELSKGSTLVPTVKNKEKQLRKGRKKGRDRLQCTHIKVHKGGGEQSTYLSFEITCFRRKKNMAVPSLKPSTIQTMRQERQKEKQNLAFC